MHPFQERMRSTVKKTIALFLLLSIGLSGCGVHTAVEESVSGANSFTVEEFHVEKGNMQIYGKLYVPEEKNDQMPAVILSHSSDMTSDSMKSYCERIADMGCVAYAFDFCGGSSKSRSDGKRSDMTVFTEVDDLKAVLESVGQLDYVNSENIYLFGTSQGGLVSALVADECPEKVNGLILLYPAFNIAELVQMFYQEYKLPFQNAFSTSLEGYQVYDHIGTFPGDVLILHGTMDFIVPASYSEKAEKMYEHCELHLIEGANHGFNAENYGVGDYDEVSWNYIAQYLQSHMTNTAQSEAHATD